MRRSSLAALAGLGLLVSAWAGQPLAKTLAGPASPQAAPAEPADTIRPGTVTGTFTVGDKTAELKYAYVKQGPSLREGAAFVIVLSDVPIEEPILLDENDYELQAAAREGKLHAVEVTFRPELQYPWGRAYHNAFPGGGSGVNAMLRFVPSLYDGTTLAGRVSAEKNSSDEVPWEGTATFSIVLDPGGKAAAAPAAAAPAPGSGTTTGTLTVGGKTAQLKYVYAHIEEDSDEKGKEKLVVLLSDVPLEESAWRDEQGLFQNAREGKLHAIWAEFDDVLNPNFAQIYHNGFESASASASGMHQFVPHLYDGKTFAGKLYVEQVKFDDTVWEYTATFSVSISPKSEDAPVAPKTEAAPEAAAGQESAPAADLPEPEVDWNALSEQQKGPARLVVEFIQAFRKKDTAALKKFMTEEEHAKLEGPFGEMALDMMSMAFSRPIKVTKVVMQGDDRAEVHLQIEGAPEPGTLRAVLVNGEWRAAK